MDQQWHAKEDSYIHLFIHTDIFICHIDGCRGLGVGACVLCVSGSQTLAKILLEAFIKLIKYETFTNFSNLY